MFLLPEGKFLCVVINVLFKANKWQINDGRWFVAVMPAGSYHPQKREVRFTISRGCRFSFSKTGKVGDSLVSVLAWASAKVLSSQWEASPHGGIHVDCSESVRGGTLGWWQYWVHFVGFFCFVFLVIFWPGNDHDLALKPTQYWKIVKITKIAGELAWRPFSCLDIHSLGECWILELPILSTGPSAQPQKILLCLPLLFLQIIFRWESMCRSHNFPC